MSNLSSTHTHTHAPLHFVLLLLQLGHSESEQERGREKVRDAFNQPATFTWVAHIVDTFARAVAPVAFSCCFNFLFLFEALPRAMKLLVHSSPEWLCYIYCCKSELFHRSLSSSPHPSSAKSVTKMFMKSIAQSVLLLLVCSTHQSLCKFTCPSSFGYFEDVNNCTRFYVCVFGEALHEKCDNGLIYSPRLKTCDRTRSLSQCVSRE